MFAPASATTTWAHFQTGCKEARKQNKTQAAKQQRSPQTFWIVDAALNKGCNGLGPAPGQRRCTSHSWRGWAGPVATAPPPPGCSRHETRTARWPWHQWPRPGTPMCPAGGGKGREWKRVALAFGPVVQFTPVGRLIHKARSHHRAQSCIKYPASTLKWLHERLMMLLFKYTCIGNNTRYVKFTAGF